MEIIRAADADIKKCEEFFQTVPEILQYLAVTQFLGSYEQGADDWNSISFCTEDRTAMVKYGIARSKENEISVALYARNSYLAGKLWLITWPKVKAAYNPKAVAANVHSSNSKSLKFCRNFFGEPYGVEPQGMWNIVEGRWEDSVLFKKILR